MTLLIVAGTGPGAGATTVAVGLAHRLTYAGQQVRLLRIAGDSRAEADAEVFASLDFLDSDGMPVEAGTLSDTAGAITIVEAPGLAEAEALAQRLGARLIVAGRQGAAVPAGTMFIETHAATSAPLRIAEDRLLAAPTVRRLIEASGAQVLSRSINGEAAVCEHLVIGAISHDAADDYFRRFPHRAVVTRSEKVDIALAAMLTGSECLILTGGHEPSPYLLDRAASTRQTTLLLAPGGTVETMRDIEGVFGSAPFSGESKVEHIGALMHAALTDDALATLTA